MFIYRFLNTHQHIIYIGRTNNIVRRMRNEHFTSRGHLPVICYQETDRVEYAEVKSLNEAKMYELFLIEKHHPKYNQSDIGGGTLTFELDDLAWQTFEFNTDRQSLTKQKLSELLTTFTEEIDTEFRYANNLLRGLDTKDWLQKLTPDEQNDYLRSIYTIQRFLDSIGEKNRDMQAQVTNERPVLQHVR